MSDLAKSCKAALSMVPSNALEHRPYSPNMVALRSQHEPYIRSMPGTPLGLDPRALTTSDFSNALSHARSSMQVDDYFSGAARYPAIMRPRSPYPEYEQEHRMFYEPQDAGKQTLAHIINRYVSCCCTMIYHNADNGRINVAASLVNIQISATAKYAKVFPHMCDDGSFPTDFMTPKTVETMRVLDSTSLFTSRAHSPPPITLSCFHMADSFRLAARSDHAIVSPAA